LRLSESRSGPIWIRCFSFYLPSP